MTPRPIDRCVHCGEPESAHHAFEAVTCRCSEERVNLGRPTHGDYYDSIGYGHCVVCGHDRECHTLAEITPVEGREEPSDGK